MRTPHNREGRLQKVVSLTRPSTNVAVHDFLDVDSVDVALHVIQAFAGVGASRISRVDALEEILTKQTAL